MSHIEKIAELYKRYGEHNKFKIPCLSETKRIIEPLPRFPKELCGNYNTYVVRRVDSKLLLLFYDDYKELAYFYTIPIPEDFVLVKKIADTERYRECPEYKNFPYCSAYDEETGEYYCTDECRELRYSKKHYAFYCCECLAFGEYEEVYEAGYKGCAPFTDVYKVIIPCEHILRKIIEMKLIDKKSPKFEGNPGIKEIRQVDYFPENIERIADMYSFTQKLIIEFDDGHKVYVVPADVYVNDGSPSQGHAKEFYYCTCGGFVRERNWWLSSYSHAKIVNIPCVHIKLAREISRKHEIHISYPPSDC